MPVRYNLFNIPNRFNLDVQNQFSALMEVSEELAPEELWDAIKDILTSTAEEHIPKRCRCQNNIWTSAKTRVNRKQEEIKNTERNCLQSTKKLIAKYNKAADTIKKPNFKKYAQI